MLILRTYLEKLGIIFVDRSGPQQRLLEIANMKKADRSSSSPKGSRQRTFTPHEWPAPLSSWGV